MSFLAGLGAAAGGFATGMQRGQDFKNSRDAAERRKTLEGREDLDYERKLSAQNDMDAARAAAGSVMQRYQQDWDKSQGPVANYMNLGGTDGSMPDQSGVDAAPARQPFKPSLTQSLKAQQAFTDTLFSRGRIDEGMQHWVQGEQQRSRVRASVAPAAKAALASGGDITKPLASFYDTLDDGYDLVSAKPVKGLDGKASYNIERRNTITGATDNLSMSSDQIAAQLDAAVVDPSKAAEYSLKQKLEAFKAVNELEQIRTRGDESRKTEGVKFNYGLQDNADKSRLRLGEIGARGAEERKTVNTREGLERTRPYTLGDGADRFVDTPQPDGSLKPTRIATNKKDAPGARATTGKQISDMVINNFGVLDPGTGRQVGSEGTARVSAAAELLMSENPGMGANEAIARAAADLGYSAKPKK